MTQAAQALIAELDQEAQAARRLLERVPADRLAWLSALEEFDAAEANFEPPQPESAAGLLPGLEEALAQARSFLGGLDDRRAAAPWRLTHRGREVFSMPRLAVVRSLLLNHWYHHRGQLVVYLRLLDVPVPVVYGRSADEDPFAAAPTA